MSDRLPELAHGAIDMVKSVVDYQDGTKCCKVCTHHGSDTGGSGSPDALPARCERNAFWFPVSEAGMCREFLRA